MLLNCLEWRPEIFANVHADTVYRWKLDGPGSGGGKPKKISGTVAEKLAAVTHDTLPRPLQIGRIGGEIVE